MITTALLHVPQDQRIADMTNPRIIGDWGLDRRISTGDAYGVCQRWARAPRRMRPPGQRGSSLGIPQ
ncbi:MAG TPA: hypothetical protein VE733_25690 [Streptosporangiaceae bacterium]|jgi:hypothetical protein|nr:hypothetical protein [Streptosporangiaceae bacterium]